MAACAATLALSAGACDDVFNARLFAQVLVGNVTNDADRARYLADVRAAGVECVFLSSCDYFEEGEERLTFFRRLEDDIRFFETNGLAVAVWINGFGYGNERKGSAARRLVGDPRLTAFDGRTNGAVCPTGAGIRRALVENVRDVARAGARMILMDDDFVQSVRPGLCCVCPNHLKLISARLGRPIGVADVRDAFTGRPNDVRRAALDVSGEIVLELARELRRAVDAVDPSVGMGLCASYTHWDVEGVDLETLLAAFAGGNRRFFRISGAPYWKPRCDGYGLDTIIEFVRQQAAWCRQLPDTTVFDENDPWPRKVAEVPAWKCELYDKATIADGVLGRHKYMFCYGPDRAETGYLDAHLANRSDDARLASLFAGTDSYGIRVIYPRQSLRDAVLPTPYCGDRDLMLQYSHAKGATLLTRNGLPARHEGRGPALVLGQAAQGVTQADLEDGIVADREAADVLAERGLDAGSSRIKVLDFSACGPDFGFVRSEPVVEFVRRAVEGFSGTPLAVRLAAPSAGVYLLVRHDPVTDEYAVLLENLTDGPLPVDLRTPRACRIVGSLRGDFRAEKNGIVLSALPAHGYAAVRFALCDPSWREWEMGEPVVGYWMGPGCPGATLTLDDAAARMLKEGGFNLAWARSREEFDLLAKWGLRGLYLLDLPFRARLPEDRWPALKDRIRSVKDHPALYMYVHSDEPPATAFEGLAADARIVRSIDPGHPLWVNLLPTYANNKQLGVDGPIDYAYWEHVRRFLDSYDPEIVGYDHYQFCRGYDGDNYFLNLSVFQQACAARGIPFVNTVQAATWVPGDAASPDAPRIPGPDEMRYLVHTTLAYGAQGIFYYVYSYPRHYGSIVSTNGVPDAKYGELKKLNPVFVATAKALRCYRLTGTFFKGRCPRGGTPYGARALLDFADGTASVPAPQGEMLKDSILVSRFDAPGRKTRLMVVNLDYRRPVAPEIRAPSAVARFDPSSGVWSPLGEAFALPLAKGEGALLEIDSREGKGD